MGLALSCLKHSAFVYLLLFQERNQIGVNEDYIELPGLSSTVTFCSPSLLWMLLGPSVPSAARHGPATLAEGEPGPGPLSLPPLPPSLGDVRSLEVLMPPRNGRINEIIPEASCSGEERCCIHGGGNYYPVMTQMLTLHLTCNPKGL